MLLVTLWTLMVGPYREDTHTQVNGHGQVKLLSLSPRGSTPWLAFPVLGDAVCANGGEK